MPKFFAIDIREVRSKWAQQSKRQFSPLEPSITASQMSIDS